MLIPASTSSLSNITNWLNHLHHEAALHSGIRSPTFTPRLFNLLYFYKASIKLLWDNRHWEKNVLRWYEKEMVWSCPVLDRIPALCPMSPGIDSMFPHDPVGSMHVSFPVTDVALTLSSCSNDINYNQTLQCHPRWGWGYLLSLVSVEVSPLCRPGEFYPHHSHSISECVGP